MDIYVYLYSYVYYLCMLSFSPCLLLPPSLISPYSLAIFGEIMYLLSWLKSTSRLLLISKYHKIRSFKQVTRWNEKRMKEKKKGTTRRKELQKNRKKEKKSKKEKKKGNTSVLSEDCPALNKAFNPIFINLFFL